MLSPLRHPCGIPCTPGEVEKAVFIRYLYSIYSYIAQLILEVHERAVIDMEQAFTVTRSILKRPLFFLLDSQQSLQKDHVPSTAKLVLHRRQVPCVPSQDFRAHRQMGTQIYIKFRVPYATQHHLWKDVQ